MGQNKFAMDNIETCDPKNLFLNMETGQLECLPGVLIPPQGYSQLLPETKVRPKNWWLKYVLLGIAAYYVMKR